MRLHLPSLAAALFAAMQIMPMSAVADESGMATMHDWRSERGITCLVAHFHSGSGEGRTKRAARRAAITSWQEFTAFEYGLDWAYYRHAGSKSIGYSKTSNGWSATVEGRPCNFRRRTRR